MPLLFFTVASNWTAIDQPTIQSAGIAVNDIKELHEISQEIRLEKETRFLYELECVFTHPFVIANPFFRKLKRTFYDRGIDDGSGPSLSISKHDRRGFSVNFYGTPA